MPEPTLEQRQQIDRQQIDRQRWTEQQQPLAKQAQTAYDSFKNRDLKDVSYFQRRETPLTAGMPTEPGGPLNREAPPATVKESRREKKKREEREKAAAKAALQDGRTAVLEDSLKRLRSIDAEFGPSWYSESRGAGEKSLMKERRKGAGLKAESARLEAEGAGALTEDVQREIRWRAQADRAAAAGDYARSLPMATKERAKAMAVKEAEELKADKLRRLFKVTQIADPAEREREEKTVARHAMYDDLKKLFRKDNPLSHEDAMRANPLTGNVLVNKGRAFFGGTKPMYVFEDRKPQRRGAAAPAPKEYLFKEAVNCVGQYKPEGALVTEAASKLQQIVCGEYAIPAFAVRDEKGKVLGSFQEKLETGEGGEDLFSWQAHPDHDLPAQVKGELLREHTLDWLLCNFDTKGENFLNRTDGHLSSFDKEASFSFLKDQGAQHMSRTYKPHSNDTIYNVLFSQFAAGNVELDLQSVVPQVQKMEALSDGEYLGLFQEMLTQKYGESGENRARAEADILKRKQNLREEYRTFFTGLLAERRANLGTPPDGGDGTFRFSDDPPEADAGA